MKYIFSLILILIGLAGYGQADAGNNTADSAVYEVWYFQDSAIDIACTQNIFAQFTNGSKMYIYQEGRGIEYLDGDTFQLETDGIYKTEIDYAAKDLTGTSAHVIVLITDDGSYIISLEYITTTTQWYKASFEHRYNAGDKIILGTINISNNNDIQLSISRITITKKSNY